MKTLLLLPILLISNAVLSQQPAEVQPFLRDIFANYSNIRDFTISSAENEAYFTLQSPLAEFSVIIMIEKKNGAWAEPEIASFSGKYADLEPFLAPDGLRLYFASNRPVDPTSDKAKDFDIWYVERPEKEGEWSIPLNMGDSINTEYNEFYPSVALSNNLYFTSYQPHSKRRDDIYMSKWDNNTYSSPIPLSDSINTKGSEFNAFIAPDESFIIFSSWNRKDGVGGGDLYISYKKGMDSWSNARNLGEKINSKQVDYCPYVNVETGTLFFTSKRSDFNVRESGYSSYRALMDEINKYENGFSRIYQVNIGKILSRKESKHR